MFFTFIGAFWEVIYFFMWVLKIYIEKEKTSFKWLLRNADQGLREKEENKSISYNQLFKYYTKKCVPSVMGPVLLFIEEITCI